MALSYPLSLPNVKAPRSVVLAAESVVARQRSVFTGQSQAQVHQGMWWQGQIQLPPMQRADAEAWLAFLTALNGLEGTFLLGPADIHPDYALLGAGGGSPGPQVDGAGQTGRTLATKGWPLSTLVLKAGDYFGLGASSSARFHKVLTDVTSDGSGDASIEIWPRLRASPLDNDPLELADPKAVFHLGSNVREWTIDYLRTFGASFSILEAL